MAPNALQIAIAVLMIAAVCRIAWVDLKTYRIPDLLNLTVASLGVFYQTLFGSDRALAAVTAALCIGTLMLLVRWAYFQKAGRVGLGMGDVKLATGATLWFSPWHLPLFFFLASASALAFALVCMRAGSGSLRTMRIPFGPFLGVALVVTWVIEVSSPYSFFQER